MNLGNGDEQHPQSEIAQEVANDDAALLSRKTVDALRERIIERMSADWPEIRLRLACGQAADRLRRGDRAGALATLEAVLAKYDH